MSALSAWAINHVFPPSPRVSPVGFLVMVIFAAGAAVGIGVGVGVGAAVGVGVGVGVGVAVGVGVGVEVGSADGVTVASGSSALLSPPQAHRDSTSAAINNKAVIFFIFHFLSEKDRCT